MLSVYYSAILVLGFSAVTSEYVESPCPGTFDYQRDGNGIFGVIHLKATGPLSSIKIIANFSISARLPNVSTDRELFIWWLNRRHSGIEAQGGEN